MNLQLWDYCPFTAYNGQCRQPRELSRADRVSQDGERAQGWSEATPRCLGTQGRGWVLTAGGVTVGVSRAYRRQFQWAVGRVGGVHDPAALVLSPYLFLQLMKVAADRKAT